MTGRKDWNSASLEECAAELIGRPAAWGPLKRKGEIYESLGRPEEALTAFRSLATAYPDQGMPVRRSLNIAASLGEWGQVLDIAPAAARLFPDRQFWWQSHHDAVEAVGGFEDLEICRAAVEVNPASWPLARVFSDLLVKEGMRQEAEAHLFRFYEDNQSLAARLRLLGLRRDDDGRESLTKEILGQEQSGPPQVVCISDFTEGLTNGLGNKLFAIASAASLAADNTAELLIGDIDGWGQNGYLKTGHESRHLGSPLPHKLSAIYPANRFVQTSVIDELCTHRLRVSGAWDLEHLEYQSGVGLEGCFIRYEYFDRHRSALLGRFEVSRDVRRHVEGHPLFHLASKAIAVHVRRTDHKVRHPEFGSDYYRRALAHFDSTLPLLLFSDDPQYCRRVLLELDEFSGRDVVVVEGNRNYVDLELMRQCLGHVLQFSTLGWWGAYLAETYPNNLVVRPKAFEPVGPPHWHSEPILAE